jgi:peptidoglycan/LPS O-acetylase OafA/YrhL
MASRPDFRLQEIDVLRGLAALTVVFSHYFPYWSRYLDDFPVIVPNALGHDAVKLFFVISGFVIFVTLERCRTVLDFAVLRFSRLYPAYWMSLALATLLGVALFGESLWLGGLVVNATMLQQFLGFGHLDNVYWSLTVELAFYANAAWLFACGLHRRTRTIVLIWLLLAAVWALSGGPSAAPVDELVEAKRRDWWSLLFALDYAPYFAMGILFYRARRHGWQWQTLALVLLAAAVEFLINSWHGLAVAGAAALLFALAVTGYLRFLVLRPALWLGAISYSLYLVHRNLGYATLTWLHEHGVAAAPAIGAATLGALVLATLLTYAVEQPASRRIRAWYRRRTGAAAPAALRSRS